MLIVFLTLDRLTAVYLGLKYPVYWTPGKTKKTLVVIWGLGLVSVIFFVLLEMHHGFWFRKDAMVYAMLSFSIAYVIFALSTYVFIFWTYLKSRSVQRTSNGEGDENSALQTFLQSRFYVSVLIIFTYLLFNVMPFTVMACLTLEPGGDVWVTDTWIEKTVIALLHLCYLSDPLIYIFLQGDVRKELCNLIGCFTDALRHFAGSHDSGVVVRNSQQDDNIVRTSV